MPDPAHDPFNVYTALGAGYMPEAAAAVAPATPTEVLEVDGVQLAPAARLMALARIRDQHRTSARSANDAMHSAREQIEDRQVRIRRLRQADNGRGSATAMTQIGQLQAEIDQFASARASAQAEVEAAGENWRDAELLLKSAIRFARDSGMTIPAPLASEGK
jgi:flagellar biosynthesis chaperone FliJ